MAKPGRKPTGLARRYNVQVALDELEHEFVARYCSYNGVSAATYGRRKMLPRDWRAQLDWLRVEQKNATLEELDGRRKEG